MIDENYTSPSSLHSPTFFVAGAFPPPVHGFANATLSVYDFLRKRGHRVIKLDTSLGAGRNVIAGTSLAILGGLLAIARIILCKRTGSILYIGITAGLRQIPDALFIFVARILRMKRVIHHHSFAYINSPNVLARLCFYLAGKEAIHITLCKTMSTGLIEQYKLQNKMHIISNAALVKAPATSSRKRSVGTDIRVGFLGALTEEKGINDFLSVAESIGHEEGVSFAIAGSLKNPDYLNRLNEFNSPREWIRYYGELTGDKKDYFLHSIDVLLFPTKYVNEAEPLVILEALASGTIVIANVRGCIGELQHSEGVVLVYNHLQFNRIAEDVIRSLCKDRSRIVSKAAFAMNTFADMQQQSLEALQNVFREFEQ